MRRLSNFTIRVHHRAPAIADARLFVRPRIQVLCFAAKSSSQTSKIDDLPPQASQTVAASEDQCASESNRRARSISRALFAAC